jgi:hypothetical protein
MGRTDGINTGLLLRNLKDRICIERRGTLKLCEQKPEREDVNLYVQEGSKEVGERENTYKTGELTTNEWKRREEPRPLKKMLKTVTSA